MGGHAQYLKGVGEVSFTTSVNPNAHHILLTTALTGGCWKRQWLQGLDRLGSPRQGSRPCRNEEGGRTSRSQPGLWPSGRVGGQVDWLRGNAEGGLRKCSSEERLRRLICCCLERPDAAPLMYNTVKYKDQYKQTKIEHSWLESPSSFWSTGHAAGVVVPSVLWVLPQLSFQLAHALNTSNAVAMFTSNLDNTHTSSSSFCCPEALSHTSLPHPSR